MIYTSFKYFPDDTIHIIVIDPGVGSDRRILGFKTNSPSFIFIAPDNGVLKFIFNEYEGDVYSITNEDFFLGGDISNTFHGRDIFAPVGAHLSKGVELSDMGEKVNDFNRGRLPVFRKTEDHLEGEVIYIDRFGNVISNIKKEFYENYREFEVSINGTLIKKFVSSFSGVLKGEALTYTGSSGFLEIGVNQGDFARAADAKISDKIKVKFK